MKNKKILRIVTDDNEKLLNNSLFLSNNIHVKEAKLYSSKQKNSFGSLVSSINSEDSENGMKTVLSALESKSLNQYIEEQINTVKNSAASYGIKSNVLFLEDDPLLSFSKMLEP